jgi:hypothetical protein
MRLWTKIGSLDIRCVGDTRGARTQTSGEPIRGGLQPWLCDGGYVGVLQDLDPIARRTHENPFPALLPRPDRR